MRTDVLKDRGEKQGQEDSESPRIRWALILHTGVRGFHAGVGAGRRRDRKEVGMPTSLHEAFPSLTAKAKGLLPSSACIAQ